MSLEFYHGKRVLVTGHTGFKGSWLCQMLENAGAELTGYALLPPTDPSLFEAAGIGRRMRSVIGDIRDAETLAKTFQEAQPEIVFHLAAQPIVREGYRDPAGTYATNVMGTVNVLECIRKTDSVRSFLNVTTDKVYKNKEWIWGYRETEELDGYDPYSNSKSCSELVTHAYKNSFFRDGQVAISTVRAGNVIGGGDFAKDRIIPDCVRAATENRLIQLRNPLSIRPYQHVLEPLYAYLLIAQKQAEDITYAGSYNVGPDDCDCITTAKLATLFCRSWGGISWEDATQKDAPHEATFLKLDSSKLKAVMGWKPRWHIEKAVDMTCRFSKVWVKWEDVSAEMDAEIEEFLKTE